MNINQRILQLLERTGLTPTEAKFYLVAHLNPKFPIKEIQKKAGLSKTSAYRAFENLRELGLLTSSQENWRKNVQSVSLKTFAERLAKEQRRLRKVELELKSIGNLMGLTAFSHLEEPLQIITDRNKIQEKAFTLFAGNWDHFLCYGSAERLIDVIGNQEEREWVKQRSKKGRTVDCWITEIGNYAHDFMPNNDKEYRNVKINIEKENQDYMTYVIGDEVITWHKDKELGNRAIIIKDPLIVRMQENMFKRIWKTK